MSAYARISLLLAIIAVIVGSLVSLRIFEDVPHIEDETAYSWQARAIAKGALFLSTPPCPECFLVPFVVDNNGLRTAKYPPGWPAMLALGVLTGARWLINPLLSGFSVWLLFLLARRISDEITALLAVLLMVTSPFFVMNSGTLLAHPWSLFLTLAFALAWLDTFPHPDSPKRIPRWLSTLIASLCLGLLILTRPLTAAAVALPFFIHAMVILVRGTNSARKCALWIALAGIIFSSIYLLWQYAITGSIFTNPYTLWWSYDTIGFGAHIGRQEGGYWLDDILPNLQVSLLFGNFDLFGWLNLSGVLLPFGLVALWRKRQAWMIIAILPALVAAYTLYWIGSWLLGPRYYYEGLASAVILSAAGLRWLAGKLPARTAAAAWRIVGTARFALVSGTAMLLIGSNLLWYLPMRINGLRGLYGTSRAQLAPFQTATAQNLAPALVFVHPFQGWRSYGTLLELSSPLNDSPFVFVYSRDAERNQIVADWLPERTIVHYYAETPFVLYTAAPPEP